MVTTDDRVDDFDGASPCWTVDALAAEAEAAAEHTARARADAATPVALIYTSVTTGVAKGAVLTHGNFAANALAWVPQLKAGDVVRGAYGKAATSPIHETDIATVAVQALLGGGHARSVYTLTGPESLDQYEKVRLIGAATGRSLSFQELPPEQVWQGLLAQGLPEEVPARLLGSLADYAVSAGPTTSTVEDLLGRPALTFADWARDHAAVFGAPVR